MIPDNYEKIVVSTDEFIDSKYEYKGIKHMHIRKFLLKNNL